MKDTQKKVPNPLAETKKQSINDIPFEDDRYPGSFFKVPGTPKPGRTAWRIS